MKAFVTRFAITFCIFLLTSKVIAQDEPLVQKSSESLTLQSTNLGFLQNSVNLFTGEVAFPLTLVSASAPGGIPVNLSLGYNTTGLASASDVWNREAPTSTVGWGWSFGFPQIIVDHKQTGTREDDDFFLAEGGLNALIYTGTQAYYSDDKQSSYTAEVYRTKSHTSFKVYFIPSLERWEIKRDGFTYIYGGQNDYPTAVQWLVKWDNWIGNSANTTNQSRQGLVWNLAKVHDQWGNHVEYTYLNVENRVSAVSGIGQYHTEASYLDEITLSDGATIDLVYADKSSYEYYEPHTERTEPDAYQERYEKKFLDEIQVFNEFGNLIERLDLRYQVSNFDGTGHYDKKKRVLIEVESYNIEGHASDPITFSYVGSGINASKLQTVTSPSGATTTFTYGSVVLSEGDLKISVSPPASGFTNQRIWSTPNYSIIAWHNPTTEIAKVFVYYWDGAWESKELFEIGNLTGQVIHPRGIGWGVFQFDSPFQIELRGDHFAMVGSSVVSNHHYLYRGYRNYSTNQWEQQTHHINVGNGTPTLLAGNQFSGLLTKSTGDLKLYKRTTTGWINDNIGLPVTGTFYGTATNNYIFAHDEDGHPDNLYFFHLDKNNVFQQSAIPAGIFFSGNDFSSWHSSNSFAYVAASQNPEYIYQWDENYQNFQRKQMLALNGDDIEFQSINNSLFFMRNYDGNDQDYRVGRYDGNNWNIRDFSKGTQVNPPVLNEDFYIIDDLNYFYIYDPNNSSWSLANVSGLAESQFYSLQNGFSTYRNNGTPEGEIYFRNANGTFSALPGTALPVKSAGSNYVVSSTGGFYLRQGNQLQSTTLSVPGGYTNPYELALFGPTSFAVYHNNQIHLWRVIDEQVEGNVTAHPVTKVTSFDGYQNTYTSFDYESSSARVDAVGTANFKQVTTVPGSSTVSSKPIGHVVTQFFNGQDISGADFGTEDIYYAILKGSPYQTSSYNSVGTLVSRTKTGYTTTVRSDLGHSNYPLFTRVNRSEELLDGVTKNTYFTYNTEGQLKESEYFNIDSKGNSDRVESFNTYFWEVYDTDLSEGIVSPVIQTESRLNGTTTSSNVSRWKQWSGAWVPSTGFQWEAGSSSFPDWHTTGAPGNWILTGNIIQRNDFGSVVEEEDILGKHTSFIYGYDRNLPIGSVYNANPNEVFYEDFGPGQVNSWSTSGTTYLDNHLTFDGGTEKAFRSGGFLNPTLFIADFKIRVFGSGYNSFKFNASSVDPAEDAGFSLRIEESGVIRLFNESTEVDAYTLNGGFNDWHTVRIQRSGNEISAYINGEEVITYTASGSDPSGSFHGFYGNGTESTVDHFRVYPADAYATTSALNDETKTLIETMDQDGLMAKTLSNAWQSPVITVDPDNRIITTLQGGSSVKYGGSFNASDPSRLMSVQPRGSESLADDFSYVRAGWTEYSHAASTWTLIDNRLVHTNSNTTSGNSGYYYNFGHELIGKVSIEFDLWVEEEKGWPDTFGFAAGGSSWDRTVNGSESAVWIAFQGDDLRAYTGSWNVLKSDMDLEGYLHRIRIVADTDADQANYYIDGHFAGSLPFRSATSGIQQVGFRNYGSTLTGTWHVDNLAVYTNGVESVAFFDATGKTVQTMSRASNGHVLISETGYDALSRPIYQTKPTRDNVDLAYRPGFVTSFSSSTGSLTGEISSLNGNEQFLYSSTSYEASPLGRSYKSGIPGSEYAVWGGSYTTTSTYSPNVSVASSDFYMGVGYSTGEYYGVRIVDPEQGKLISFYDKSGNLVLTKQGKVDVVDASGSVLNDFLYTRYHYTDGTRTSEVAPPNNYQIPSLPEGGGTPPADAYSTISQFDEMGRLIDESTPDGGTMLYIYDEIGRAKFIRTGSNDIKYFRYNSFGQLTEEGLWDTNWSSLSGTTSIPSNIATWRVKYIYDGLNNVIETAYNNDASSDAESKETYGYDKYDRVTAVSLYVYDYSTSPQVVNYTYDHLGNLIDETYDGFTIRSTYFDTNGLLKSIGTPGNTDRFAQYSFDGFGNLYQEKQDDQTITTTYSYDLRDWLTSIDNAYFREDLNYSSGGYNGAGFHNGLIASTAFTFKSGSWSGASRPANYTYQYDYDKLGRLVSANHTSDNSYDVGIGANKEIRYDANGNIKSYHRGTTPYTYEYTFGTNKVINTENDGSNNFQYDANGNVRRVFPKGYTNIDYDPHDNQVTKIDRLPGGLQLGVDDIFVTGEIELQQPTGKKYIRQEGARIILKQGFQSSYTGLGMEGTTVKPDYKTSFQYGSGSERVYKRDEELQGSSDLEAIYVRGLNSYPIAIRTKDQLGNESVVRYINGPAGLISTKETGGDYFVIKDHIGSSRIVLQDDGAVSSTYNYLPMGGLMNSTVSENSPYRFQGQEYDPETGLHNFRARFYDDELGRFYGVDPRNQFSSPYTGIGNNAVNGTDPDGEWFGIDDGIAFIVGGAINLGVNIVQGNVSGNPLEILGKGAAAFAAGGSAGTLALYGPAGWAAGGAIVGGTNAWLGGATGTDIAIGAGLGVVTGVAGGAIGTALTPAISSLTNGISSPVLQGVVGGSLGGAATGGLIGGTVNAIRGDGFWSGAGQGAWQGALTGGIAGGSSAYAFSRHHGINPWNGQRIQRPEPPRIEGIRVRHHTDLKGLRGIQRDRKIWSSRPVEEPGVHVELPPFRDPTDVYLGNKRGGYVEFTHPEHSIKAPPGYIGKGNSGKIPTLKPLDISNANPTFNYWGLWKWFR